MGNIQTVEKVQAVENVQTVEEVQTVQQPATCEICFEEKPSVHGSVYKKSTKCSEPHSFCRDCMTKHIQYKIEDKIGMIRCPGVNCPAMLDPVKCCSLISKESFVEWSDLLVNVWIAHQGHRRAVCPYQSCSEVVIDECRGGGRQVCPKCTRVFCFGCGVEWTIDHHKVCEFEEKVFLNAANKENWQRCPNCRFFVQRSTGCNMIKCRCGTTFCYKCGLQNCRCVRGHCICCLFVVFLALVVSVILFVKFIM